MVKKETIQTEKEIELDEGQEAFAQYLLGKLADNPKLIESISDNVRNKMKEDFKDVLDIAKVYRKHPKYGEMCADCKLIDAFEKKEEEEG